MLLPRPQCHQCRRHTSREVLCIHIKAIRVLQFPGVKTAVFSQKIVANNLGEIYVAVTYKGDHCFEIK